MTDINYLIERDGLQQLKIEGKTVYLHNDHRFVLPLIYNAQEKGLLPRPCKIITFDAHTDTCPVREQQLTVVKKMIKNGYNFTDLAALTENLAHNDDDWIQAGMHLGLFSDAIIFGVDKSLSETERSKTIKDLNDRNHCIEIRSSFPGSMFEYQGELSDLAREGTQKHFWNLLGWEYVVRKGFSFSKTNEQVLIDIDLDAFAAQWKDYIFPWPDEVFIDQFLKESEYDATKGWSGKKFFNHFFDNCGLITIAREENCCGGKEKSKEIFEKVNKYIFDSKLKI